MVTNTLWPVLGTASIYSYPSLTSKLSQRNKKSNPLKSEGVVHDWREKIIPCLLRLNLHHMIKASNNLVLPSHSVGMTTPFTVFIFLLLQNIGREKKERKTRVNLHREWGKVDHESCHKNWKGFCFFPPWTFHLACRPNAKLWPNGSTMTNWV